MQKKEEVKRLKALKMKEIRAKLEKIGKVGGIGHDPCKHRADYQQHYAKAFHQYSTSWTLKLIGIPRRTIRR